MKRRVVFLLPLMAAHFVLAADPAGRWSEEKANAWYAKQPWLVGANYVPSDAINQLEMFQAETFNPLLNDKELGLAEGIGMNTMRVFLHDQLWEQDPDGFKKRLDAFWELPRSTTFGRCWCCLIRAGTRILSLGRSIRRFRGFITRDGCRARGRRG